MKDFEILAHTADIKLKVYGKTLTEFFKHALEGMFTITEPNISGCEYKDGRIKCKNLPERREILVESLNIDSLLVDFLSEALSLSDIYNEVFLDMEVIEVSDKKIKAILHGIKFNKFEVVEVKAVTYHGLKVEKVDDLWQAEILFDI